MKQLVIVENGYDGKASLIYIAVHSLKGEDVFYSLDDFNEYIIANDDICIVGEYDAMEDGIYYHECGLSSYDRWCPYEENQYEEWYGSYPSYEEDEEDLLDEEEVFISDEEWNDFIVKNDFIEGFEDAIIKLPFKPYIEWENGDDTTIVIWYEDTGKHPNPHNLMFATVPNGQLRDFEIGHDLTDRVAMHWDFVNEEGHGEVTWLVCKEPNVTKDIEGGKLLYPLPSYEWLDEKQEVLSYLDSCYIHKTLWFEWKARDIYDFPTAEL